MNNKKTKVAAVSATVAAVLGAALLWGPTAGAQEGEEPSAVLVKVSDQQDVSTDATGRVTLRLTDGEKNQRCLDVERIESFTIQLAGNKSGGRDPLFVQTAQNTNCSIKLRFFDINTQPVAGHVVRLGYTADGQVQTFADGQVPPPPPEPEPTPEPTAEPTPEPDPDPEPGDSLLSAAGGATLPQGITPVGDVDAGDYAAVVPEGVFCYAALLSANDPNEILTNMIVSGPANAAFTVKPAHEGVDVAFIHVDCAAG